MITQRYADETDRTRRRATAGGFGAILLWSTTVAVARSLSEQLGPLTAAAGVYSVAGILSLACLVRCPRKRRQLRGLPRKYLFGCGMLFVFYMLVLFPAVGLAADHQQVLEVGLLNYLWPALTLLLSVALLDKAPGMLLLPGTLLALTGVFFVLTQGTHLSWLLFIHNMTANPAPYSLGLAAAISWALYSVLARRWAGDSATGAVEPFLLVTAIVLLLICLFRNEPRAWTIHSIVEMIFLGAATYFAYELWDTAMRKGNVVLVAAGSYLTPLFSTMVSCLYLTVWPGQGLWLGCGMLMAGSLMSWRSLESPVRRTQT